MHLTRSTRLQAKKVDWADLSDNPPSYIEIKREISRWAAGITRSFARMPQRTDPRYENRMREAYISTCDNIAIIAEDPEDIDAGMRIAYMWVQVTPYAGLIRVNGGELNLNKGPEHILAGWPAIVAGRYRQLRELEQGEYHLNELADINTWISGGKYESSYTEVETEGRNTYAGKPQVSNNLVDPGLFNIETWEALQEERPSLAWRITGHPRGKLSTDPHTLESQLEAYVREAEEMGWPRQGKENCYLLWELLSEEHQAALKHTPSIQAIRRAGVEGEIGQSLICGLSGMIVSLKNMWATATQSPAGSYLTTGYHQGPMETMREFAERLHLDFSRDLGMSWTNGRARNVGTWSGSS